MFDLAGTHVPAGTADGFAQGIFAVATDSGVLLAARIVAVEEQGNTPA
ncbi:MAG: hypothetical protein ACRDFX_04675 [Chloroflexota bacterium]